MSEASIITRAVGASSGSVSKLTGEKATRRKPAPRRVRGPPGTLGLHTLPLRVRHGKQDGLHSCEFRNPGALRLRGAGRTTPASAPHLALSTLG